MDLYPIVAGEFRLYYGLWYVDWSIDSLRTLLGINGGGDICTNAHMEFGLIYAHFPLMIDLIKWIFSNLVIYYKSIDSVVFPLT